MFNRLHATLLCCLFLLSTPNGGFCATGPHAALLEEFTPIKNHVLLPRVLLTSSGGEKMLLSELVRKSHRHMRLIHLWAPSCPPCSAEMKGLDAVLVSLNDQDIDIFIIAEDHQATHAVPAFMRRYSINNLVSWYDTEQSLERALTPEGLPVTYLLSEENRLIGVKAGMINWTALLTR